MHTCKAHFHKVYRRFVYINLYQFMLIILYYFILMYILIIFSLCKKIFFNISLFYKFPLFSYTDLLNAFMHFLLLILLFEININQLISLIGYSS